MEIIRDIDRLHPYVRDCLTNALSSCHKEGLNVFPFETFRDLSRQKEMIETGKSKAKPGKSLHFYGLAVDLAFKDAHGWTWSGDWDSVGKIMVKNGFEWGRSFRRFPEDCHFQMTAGLTAVDCYNLFVFGGIGKVWESIYKRVAPPLVS